MLAEGYWSPARRAITHLELPAICPRCGHCPADAVHMLWTCPCSVDHEPPAVSKTQEQAVLVAKEHEFAFLYMRGILPHASMQARDAPSARTQVHLVGVPLVGGPWTGSEYCTDVTGGMYTTIPEA